MKNKSAFLLESCCFLLILLFVYTAVSKLIDINAFEHQMHNQAFPGWMADVLVLALPPVELITAGLLIFAATRAYGLYISFILMGLFTGYIALVLLHVFDRVPCSCGGVLQLMGWKTHFIFNLFFWLSSYTGIYLTYRERRIKARSL